MKKNKWLLLWQKTIGLFAQSKMEILLVQMMIVWVDRMLMKKCMLNANTWKKKDQGD